MNITAILLIAVIGIMFLVLEITLINLLIDSIRGKDLFLSCIGGLTLIGVCLLEILTFITICPELKQDRYADYQVEQKVIGIEKVCDLEQDRMRNIIGEYAQLSRKIGEEYFK